MSSTIAPLDMAVYRQTALARELAQRQAADRRCQAAWQTARRAARVLKDDFGARRVIVFGSLAHGAWFGTHSDIDLAVEGISPDAFWRAWCALDRLDPTFEIDLVAIEEAPERLGGEISRSGVEL